MLDRFDFPIPSNTGMPEASTRNHRRSVRLQGYDYILPGAYFVTVVTHQRACLFGDVVDGEMRLNAFGDIAKDEWLRSIILRPFVKLYPEEFVVMPNHIHGIIWIVELDMDNGRGAATLRPYKPYDKHTHNVTPHSLGAIVRAYKSAVTYRINALRSSRGLPIWQRNYYEYILRNQSELVDIAGYIIANSENWASDRENTL